MANVRWRNSVAHKEWVWLRTGKLLDPETEHTRSLDSSTLVYHSDTMEMVSEPSSVCRKKSSRYPQISLYLHGSSLCHRPCSFPQVAWWNLVQIAASLQHLQISSDFHQILSVPYQSLIIFLPTLDYILLETSANEGKVGSISAPTTKFVLFREC